MTYKLDANHTIIQSVFKGQVYLSFLFVFFIFKILKNPNEGFYRIVQIVYPNRLIILKLQGKKHCLVEVHKYLDNSHAFK